ncbi:MAG: hypothetical protein GYA17_17450 [Chloroflexi bacterium]|nr:hypothetical protein [Chloroflexota bacterium]
MTVEEDPAPLEEEPTADETPSTPAPRPGRRQHLRNFGLVAGLILLLAFFFGFTYSTLEDFFVIPTATPLPQPTVTPLPSHTPTHTPTATPLPTATPMPTPASAYSVLDLGMIDPPVPGGGSGIVLDDDTATVDPPFSNIQWTTSEQIAEQLNVVLSEPYHATFGPGAITWRTDVNLGSGYYELYVMDTAYSSGGELNFAVTSNGAPLAPLLSRGQVNFQSSWSDFPQIYDAWRNIGLYYLPQDGPLEISTSWSMRDEYTIVAVDRVAIVPRPDSSGPLLGPIPQDRLRYLVDDAAAEFDSLRYLIPIDDRLAWNDAFQEIVNPDSAVLVHWQLPDPMPNARYEAIVWIPPVESRAEATYRLLVNGEPLDLDSGAHETTLHMADFAGGAWVSVGVWDIPLIAGNVVQLSLEMEVQADTMGEVPVDAALFLETPHQ